MSTTPTPTFPYRLFDADNHLYETQDSLTKVRAVLSACIPIPTFGVVARPGAMKDHLKDGNPDDKSCRGIFGEPTRSVPAFREPGPRLFAV